LPDEKEKLRCRVQADQRQRRPSVSSLPGSHASDPVTKKKPPLAHVSTKRRGADCDAESDILEVRRMESYAPE